MEGTLTFLGTGTSMGVPTLGCGCAVCTSTDPHDKRLRPSIAVRWPCPEPDPAHPEAARPVRARKGYLPFPPIQEGMCEWVVLIDTGPDFRQQALRAAVKHVDAVFYTHSHADHIFGLDDLHPLNYRKSAPIPLYATSETRAVLESIYSYTFSPESKYPNRAKVALKDVE